MGGVHHGGRDWDALLTACRLCPRECGVNRTAGQRGVCGAGAQPMVAKACLHHWEEPPLSGTRGSGTVFFSRCNLRCVFCQNHPISQGGIGMEVGIERLVEIFLEQQARGAHNLNLVSPTHYLPPIAEALVAAKARGLTVPVVWNSNGYESVEALTRLEGLVDVYLPDFKYADGRLAARLSGAGDYPQRAAAAVTEMVRQVGETEFDGEGLVRRGVILRHLVLPGEAGNTRAVLDWVRENLPCGVHVSLMAQYTPAHRAAGPRAERQFGALSRPLAREEYEAAVDHFLAIGLEHGFAQELDSATPAYTPSFCLEGVIHAGSARPTPPTGGETASSGSAGDGPRPQGRPERSGPRPPGCRPA